MKFYQFERKQLIKASLGEVWDFISSPHNLKLITPPSMKFEVTSSNLPERIHDDLTIRYRVSPLPIFRTTWVTKITLVENHKFFIDQQEVGPYKLWHHRHEIEETGDGVLMRDVVTYIPPFGLLGRLLNLLIIRGKLKKIFDYREHRITELIG